MNIIEKSFLWEKIFEYSLDDPNSKFPFSARLRKENGWKKNYADRVIEEYKKFMYLGSISNHPVTPSEDVDQVWHLHMIYTRDWKDFCKNVLGREFHHGPTRGGKDEEEKFLELYEKTVDLYIANFGEIPRDIWPISSKRFEITDYKRVDFRKNWVIPVGDIRSIFRVLFIEIKKKIKL